MVKMMQNEWVHVTLVDVSELGGGDFSGGLFLKSLRLFYDLSDTSFIFSNSKC